MSASWTAPYFSGAVNILKSNEWNISQKEIRKFQLLSSKDQFDFKFTDVESESKYNHNAPGLLYLIIIAKKFFPNASDYNALIYFQQFIHLLVTLSIIALIKDKYCKIAFFVLYGVNPLILYFVNFPFYYFWQSVPAAFLLVNYILKKKLNWALLVSSPILALMFLTRPTSIAVIGMFFLVSLLKKEKMHILISAIIVFSLTYLSLRIPTVHSPWHTLFVGTNAYSSNVKLSDENGYEEYRNKFKSNISYSDSVLKGDTAQVKKYIDYMEVSYFNILKSHPSKIIKNGFLNVISSFGFGYKPGNSALIYLNIILALAFMTVLIKLRLWWFSLFILSANILFTPYFPPIAAYMFGGYILIVYTGIFSIKMIRTQYLFKKS
jgi:hypothetical protein